MNLCKLKLVVKLVPAMCNSKSNISQHQKDIYKKNNEMSLFKVSYVIAVLFREFIHNPSQAIVNAMAYNRIEMSSLKQAR